MKWIGRHVFDKKSTFKEDVVIEKTITTSGGESIEGSGDITTLPKLQSVGSASGAEATLNYIGGTIQMFHSTSQFPMLTMGNQTNDSTAPSLLMANSRGTGAGNIGQVGDLCGSVYFRAMDTSVSPVPTLYASIDAKIDVPTHGQESGKLSLSVANHNATMGDGLILTGGSEASEIDVTVGLGANSVVTVPGHIAGDVTGDLTGNADTATALATSRNFQADLASTSTAGFTGAASCTPGVTGVLAVGNGGTGLTGISTLLNSNVTSVSGASGTVTSIGNLTGDVTSSNRATTLAATQPNIESIGTAGDTLAILGDDINLINITSTKPNILVSNTTNDNRCAALEFRSERNTGSVLASNDGDDIGNIKFRGYNDGTPAFIAWGDIESDIIDASTGAEKGRLNLSVAGNGSSRLGISIVGDGTTTAVTIPGKIQGDYTPTLSVVTDSTINPLVAGTEYVVNDGNGGDMVLPSAVQGLRITVILGTGIASGTFNVSTADSGDLLVGYAILEKANYAGNRAYFAPDGSSDVTVTLNGTTKGGRIGDKLEFLGISATEWRVRYTGIYSGTAATPFS